MMSLSNDRQADIVDVSRYLADILNSDNVYFDNMVSQIYPPIKLIPLIPKSRFGLAFVNF